MCVELDSKMLSLFLYIYLGTFLKEMLFVKVLMEDTVYSGFFFLLEENKIIKKTTLALLHLFIFFMLLFLFESQMMFSLAYIVLFTDLRSALYFHCSICLQQYKFRAASNNYFDNQLIYQLLLQLND